MNFMGIYFVFEIGFGDIELSVKLLKKTTLLKNTFTSIATCKLKYDKMEFLEFWQIVICYKTVSFGICMGDLKINTKYSHAEFFFVFRIFRGNWPMYFRCNHFLSQGIFLFHAQCIYGLEYHGYCCLRF